MYCGKSNFHMSFQYCAYRIARIWSIAGFDTFNFAKYISTGDFNECPKAYPSKVTLPPEGVNKDVKHVIETSESMQSTIIRSFSVHDGISN